ncbi:HAD family hydrolase [Sphingorhabdus arenilitoris]|uniref:HAD family hydrolase n=1 Tax=Sphingorhabdus arenilitoris TaxID=1490041 RepID=A0ABV8RJ00_9SPHN
MTKPLIISDCDEVLLHMVVPFRDWVDEAHDIDFSLDNHDFSQALTYRHDGSFVEPVKIWELLGGFFDSEMHRQPPIAGAVPAMTALAQRADIAILTNLQDHRAEARAEQLKAIGIEAPIFTNQGPKGQALARIVAEYQPSVAVFIDDMGGHHESVGEVQPDVWRLHMVGEPLMARHIKPAPHAHARIDEWDAAHIWIEERLLAAAPAPRTEGKAL